MAQTHPKETDNEDRFSTHVLDYEDTKKGEHATCHTEDISSKERGDRKLTVRLLSNSDKHTSAEYDYCAYATLLSESVQNEKYNSGFA